jgi:hypothetical protein
MHPVHGQLVCIMVMNFVLESNIMVLMWGNKKLGRKVKEREREAEKKSKRGGRRSNERKKNTRKNTTIVDQNFIHQKLINTVQSCA